MGKALGRTAKIAERRKDVVRTRSSNLFFNNAPGETNMGKEMESEEFKKLISLGES